MMWNFANFNVERIRYHAVIGDKIKPVAGVQQQLDTLAKDLVFQKIYGQEIAFRKLRKPDVENAAKIYITRFSSTRTAVRESLRSGIKTSRRTNLLPLYLTIKCRMLGMTPS